MCRGFPLLQEGRVAVGPKFLQKWRMCEKLVAARERLTVTVAQWDFKIANAAVSVSIGVVGLPLKQIAWILPQPDRLRRQHLSS
jgi:hypothetical protein